MGFHRSLLTFIFLVLASLSFISFSYSLPSEYSILEHDIDAFLSDDRVVEIFQQWKQNHQKVYEHGEEAETRFANFKRNLKYILERNAKKRPSKGQHRVGLNKFADMSNEEFRQTYLAKVKKPIQKRSNLLSRRKVQSCDPPSSLDWRNYGIVTAVKNQESCGSCWAFSTTGAIEGINAIVTGNLISLSEQELVDCDSTNYGCEGGYMDYAFEWVINNGGIDSEANYPYTGVDGTCNITKEEEEKVVSIDGYQDVEQSDSALQCAVVQQPISVGIDASSIDFQLYTGGIYDGSCSSDPDEIDHAVLIVGYGAEDDEKYWIVKNSWGTSWGIEGYFYLKRDADITYGVCAVNAMASYPTKESSSSPSPYPSPTVPPPPPPPPPPATPPPPPPSPSPSDCGDFSYCPSDETCCCLFEFFDYCLIYGCCAYENAVCCTGTEYCCPSDYPICDIQQGLCLKNSGDYLGVAAKKRHMAKHKFPWDKKVEEIIETETTYLPLQWRRNQFAAMR